MFIVKDLRLISYTRMSMRRSSSKGGMRTVFIVEIKTCSVAVPPVGLVLHGRLQLLVGSLPYPFGPYLAICKVT